MKLRKLEIYGFKSFAERTEILFESGITGIVGPNGSGKSNIADAVRWVLGEQSPKTLRGGKMEDVIFNGTEKRRKLSWCEVTLTFDNQDHSMPLDFNEIAVTRRVYRNGDSEYMLNRNACRLKDIVDLFRDTGIGKEGYSLIGQGRIDEILSAKSEDRRHIFEEAAGIVKYKARKLEAERRLQNTQQNLDRVEDIISELEGRLEPLEHQSRTAREYLQLRDELKGLELNAFLERTDRYNQRSGELKQTLDALSEGIARATAEEAQAADERAATQTLLSEREAQTAEARDAIQTLIRDVEAQEGACQVLKERIAAAQREAQRLTGLIEEITSRQADGARRIDDINQRLSSERSAADDAGLRLKQMQQQVQSLEDRIAEDEARVESLRAARIEAMNRLSDVRSEQARLTALSGAADNRVRLLEQTANGLRADLEEAQTATRAARERLNEELDGKSALDKALADIQQRVAMAGARAEQAAERQRAMTAERQDAASRLKVLEEMQRDYEGYQNSVKQALLYARRSGMNGVHGVVANLISVPKNLERALDMVLGGALQNIVVDTEEDAKRLIDYLRSGRLGRATFLPVSAVRGRTLSPVERQVLGMPGCLGLASELITFDKKYQGIVDSLLGRTVVAENLDRGIQIQRAGHHAFRLVTLEGDVMHSGGSMTGGSVASRVTNLLSREREISEHRERVQNLTSRLDELKAEIEAVERDRANLKQERSDLFEKDRQQEIACAREEAHVKAAADTENDRSEQLKRTLAEIEHLNAQKADIAADLEALTARRDDDQRGSEDRQAEIAALVDSVAVRRAELETRRQDLADERVVQAARERGLTALNAELQQALSQRTDDEGTVAANRDLLAAAKEQLQQDEARLRSDSTGMQALKASLDQTRRRFADLDRERISAQSRLKELNERLDSVRGDLAAFAEKQHRVEMQQSRLESEFTAMNQHIWEDYELTYAGAEAFRQPDFRLGESEKRIAAIRSQIRAMGAVNVGAVDEYRQTLERFEDLSAQRDDLTKAQVDLGGVISDLMKKMEVQFRAQFAALNENFKQTFANLFGGGRAELQLADEKDVLNCDISIIAQPPGKRLQMLSLLSGGERALTAIAILFAMLKLKPTPFCFLDEIEAALDDANIDNFADYLRDYSRDTQFVVITHRKGTMERCDALYGVAMEEKGVTRLVSVRMSEALTA
ncbi:MAG: chromosome segregation protein SMC [Clostridia bacterium]|nr:chromosome segregation protein SMC [Clostridia bacterium]